MGVDAKGRDRRPETLDGHDIEFWHREATVAAAVIRGLMASGVPMKDVKELRQRARELYDGIG